MRLLYGVMWNRKDPERTWSGTGYSLYNAFKNINDIDIELIDTMPSNLEKIITTPAQLRYKNHRIYREQKTYNKYLIRLQEIKADKKLKGQNAPMLSIARAYTRNYKNQYIYMDLNPECMRNIRDNKPDLARYLPLAETKKEVADWQYNFQKDAYKNCKGLFTMSEWVRQLIINNMGISPDKVHNVGAGINLDYDRIKNEKKNNNKILFVGKDFYRKGGDIVVKSFQMLKREMPDAELYIAGPDKRPEEIDVAPEGIHFLGLLSYKEVTEYFNKCDIFCMPSRFEAFGLVFIEALVSGLPCIVNNDFFMKEIIQDGKNGYVISIEESNAAESMKNKMKDLLCNEEIKKYVLDNREKYIKEYSWETVAHKMVKIIRGN